MLDISKVVRPMLDFEIGPIRPPSEAHSLLVRVTRNCPWNRCAFCSVYSQQRFSIRQAQEVIDDIKSMAECANLLRLTSEKLGYAGEINQRVLLSAAASAGSVQGLGQVAAFLGGGGKNVFLQDANSLVMKPEQLSKVLSFLVETFPSISRITTYARSHTLTRRSLQSLSGLRQLGLTRIHVGLESGSDTVLQLVQKGVNADRQIEAGRRALQAGFELSEYYMPGLGGREHWRQHAEQSARVLSSINPHFIRLRTTAILPGTALGELVDSGQLLPMNDEEVVHELRLFVENLDTTAMVQSDHILNLLGELEGQLPGDKPRLLEIIDRFLAMPLEQRRAFIVGRRAGFLQSLDDLDNPGLSRQASALLQQVMALGEGFDQAMQSMLQRFV